MFRRLLQTTTTRRLLLSVALYGTVLAVSPSAASAEIRITEGDDCPDVVAPVAYLYQAFFLREPDPQGLDFWVRFVTGPDGGLSAAAANFATSPEYVERYGEMTNEEFVFALYPNVFGRAPDPGGLRFWTNDLDEGNRTRSEVILVWSISEEFVGEEVSPSPLIYDFNRQEYWCGTGPAIIEVARVPLAFAQQIGVGNEEGPLDASIIGLTPDGTHVISAAGSRPSLYVQPSLGAGIASYRVTIYSEGPWVLSSEWQPPPWRTY